MLNNVVIKGIKGITNIVMSEQNISKKNKSITKFNFFLTFKYSLSVNLLGKNPRLCLDNFFQGNFSPGSFFRYGEISE